MIRQRPGFTEGATLCFITDKDAIVGMRIDETIDTGPDSDFHSPTADTTIRYCRGSAS